MVDGIRIETLLDEYKINPNFISLIKIDIEGGEIWIIPSIKNFLNKYKPLLYISIHFTFLDNADIDKILNILFDIYKKCFIFTNNGNKIEKNKDEIMNNRLTSLIFQS